jgi:hypothetical protein
MRKRTFQPRKAPRSHSQKLFPSHSPRNVDNSATGSSVLPFRAELFARSVLQDTINIPAPAGGSTGYCQ